MLQLLGRVASQPTWRLSSSTAPTWTKRCPLNRKMCYVNGITRLSCCCVLLRPSPPACSDMCPYTAPLRLVTRCRMLLPSKHRPSNVVQVDVYSLGCILNECWTRRSPWKDHEHFFQVRDPATASQSLSYSAASPVLRCLAVHRRPGLLMDTGPTPCQKCAAARAVRSPVSM